MVQKLFGNYEVVVVGGGTAGTVAAIASARNGANTLLVERYGYVGGMSTGGMINLYCTFYNAKGERVIGGIAQEIVDRLEKIEATSGPIRDYCRKAGFWTLFNSQILQIVLFEMLEESGVNLLLHSYLIDVVVQDNVLKGIVVVNKSGTQLIMGNVFIDTTGDGDLVALAGIPFEQTDIEAINPVTLEFRVGGVNGDKVIEYIEEHPDQFEFVVSPQELSKQRCFDLPLHSFPGLESAIKQGKLPPDLTSKQIWFNTYEPDRGIFTFNATRVKEVDGADIKDLTDAEVKARKQIMPLIHFLKENFPGFENAYLLDIAPQMGIRETKRIVGEYTITEDDVIEGRSQEDVVAQTPCQIDIHGSTADKDEFFWIEPEELRALAFDIPYRSLLPKRIDNVLVAGRCISATRKGLAAIRFMPPCMATGQAAGTAAALAARKGVTPRKVDINELQSLLKRQDALLDRTIPELE